MSCVPGYVGGDFCPLATAYRRLYREHQSLKISLIPLTGIGEPSQFQSEITYQSFLNGCCRFRWYVLPFHHKGSFLLLIFVATKTINFRLASIFLPFLFLNGQILLAHELMHTTYHVVKKIKRWCSEKKKKDVLYSKSLTEGQFGYYVKNYEQHTDF